MFSREEQDITKNPEVMVLFLKDTNNTAKILIDKHQNEEDVSAYQLLIKNYRSLKSFRGAMTDSLNAVFAETLNQFMRLETRAVGNKDTYKNILQEMQMDYHSSQRTVNDEEKAEK